jgi:PUA domain protein
MKVKSRHHLRRDEIERIEDTVSEALGVDLDAERYEHVEFEEAPVDLVLVDGEPTVAYFDDGEGGTEPFLTVRGANVRPPTRRTVTVDAGAVSFVSDGADVMRPGIVEADDAIDAGDLVIVVEETHGKALAVGRARVPGADMVGDSGKVVDSVHHVGDELFEFRP